MATTLVDAPESTSRDIPSSSPRATTVKVLLACGIAYSVLYIVANDLIAATIYDGYSRIDQAISELSSTEAPSRVFLTAMLPIFTVLVFALGIGIWKSAEGNRALRVTGGILIAQGVMFPFWLLAPMTSRETVAERTTSANDTGHLILSALAVLFIVAEMGCSATALGKRFRLFSIATLVTVLVFGALTGVLAPNVQSGDPTPWMGFVERISYGAWLLWMSVLAITLLQRRAGRRAVLAITSAAKGGDLVPY